MKSEHSSIIVLILFKKIDWKKFSMPEKKGGKVQYYKKVTVLLKNASFEKTDRISGHSDCN